MLNLLKQLLGFDLEDNSKDLLLNHYIQQAKLVACGYCNVDSLPEKYDNIVCELALYLYRNKDSTGYKAVKQGERSITFDDNEIPKHIRTGLPLPRIKVGDG